MDPVTTTAPVGQIKSPKSKQKHNTRRHVIESAIDLTGGTLGGIANVYVGQPLDTVKVKLQTFPGVYRNSYHCFTTTFKESGIARGLYAGTIPSLIANIAENAILFASYGLCQKGIGIIAGKNVHDLSVIQNAVAGSCGSFFSALALCPTELVKCRLQAMKELQSSGKLTGPLANIKHIGPTLLVKHILRQEGVSGLFHGLKATIYREMPGYFFFFGGYEACRMFLTPPGKTKDDLNSLWLLLCGGMGGVAFWVSVFPTDVIKSRVQVAGSSAQLEPKRSYFGTMLHIARSEGVMALYKGLGPTLVRSFISTAALFYTYENTKKFLTNAAFSKDSHESQH